MPNTVHAITIQNLAMPNTVHASTTQNLSTPNTVHASTTQNLAMPNTVHASKSTHFIFFASSWKHPQTKDWLKDANRSLGEGIKAVGKENKNWLEEISHVLWAHRTMIKSSNGDTPFSLTYGTEAVIPAEIGMPTKARASSNREAKMQEANGKKILTTPKLDKEIHASSQETLCIGEQTRQAV
ncbi:reverse transcriptase domain-containing protein [Tanacetum coccineum]|uniref:Reverse transcriptase domain-containing protein n=1 Tax=Tanacetum coccineum TaxID=301880 RepID=A0ABQ5IJ25_9ASTR